VTTENQLAIAANALSTMALGSFWVDGAQLHV